MKALKRTTSLLLVAVMLFTMIAGSTISASAAAWTIQRQWDSEWKSVYVGGRTLYDTACGIFSIVNAVGYLTGNAPDVVSVAKWANSIGAFNTSSFGGTDRSVLYPRIQAKYGGTYGFTCDVGSGSGYWAGSSSSKLKNHLANGGVAIGHVPGHFIAVVGYDSSSNLFHVYDSAPSSSRGTATYGDTGLGDCWVTQSRLATGKLKLDWFCLLSSTYTGPSAEYLALEALINDSLKLICVDYTNSEVIAIRNAYTNAVAVLNNTSSKDADYTSAYNSLYAAINPTANILSVGKSYSAVNTRTDTYADDAKRLTDGVKGNLDGGVNYSGWNGNADIVVDLGWEMESNTYTVYFAGGAWGISSPVDNVNVTVSYSADGVNFTPINTSGGKAVLKKGSGISVEGVDSWSTYELTLTSGPVWARYIKLQISHVDGGHIWLDEVEIAKYNEPFLTDRFYVNGMNTSVQAGQCVIFTSGFGEITAEKANHRWTRNIIATINSDGSFTVDEVFVGGGDDVKSVTLTDDQIMIAAHAWEGVEDSVPGSANNVNLLGTLNAGDIITFSGVTTALGYYDVLAYGTITHKECAHSYSFAVTAPTCTKQGYTTYTCALCGDSYVDNYVSASHTAGTAADCENDQVCTVCGEVLVPAHGHGYDSVVTAPDCVNGGYTTYSCSVCGDSYVSEEVDALGHTEGEWVTLEDGSKELRCAVCGELLDSEKAPSYKVGDVTGDGKINMLDYMKVKSYYFGATTLTDDQLVRADATGDGKINMLDYMKIKSLVFAS